MKSLFKIDSAYHSWGDVILSWQPQGNYLATAGRNCIVHIFGRVGDAVDEIAVEQSGPVLALEWDAEGSSLAILQQGSGVIKIWESAGRSVTDLETNLKDPTFIRWSIRGLLLAIGTAKGNLLIYNHKNRKKIPIMGKHPKKITGGAWTPNNQLVLVSEDRTLTLSNAEGSTLHQTLLEQIPLDVRCGAYTIGQDGKSTTDCLVAINLGRKSVFLFEPANIDNSVELAFNDGYGHIIDHRWFGDGQLLVAFSLGYIVAASTKPNEIGQERFSGQFFALKLIRIAFSAVANRLAIYGDSGIKIVDITDWKERQSDGISMKENEENELCLLEYSHDGQIFSVASTHGIVQNYLASMPSITACYMKTMALLSSLKEVSVLDAVEHGVLYSVTVDIEPAFIALGPKHVAVGMNNRVWFYRLAGKKGELINEQEYMGNVSEVRLSAEWAAVACEGKITLHPIERQAKLEQQRKVLPDREEVTATSLALVNDFLIFGTNRGIIEYFSLADWASLPSCELRHGEPIRSIFPNHIGTRVCFIDTTGHGFLYNPITAQTIEIPDFSRTFTLLLWDHAAPNIFAAASKDEFALYMCAPTIRGTQVIRLGEMTVEDSGDVKVDALATKLEGGGTPMLLNNGTLTCHKSDSSLLIAPSVTHVHLEVQGKLSEEKQLQAFGQNLHLLQWEKCWDLALSLKNRGLWLALGDQAMHHLDLDIAIRVYRHLADAGMVFALEKIAQLEEKNLVAGHMAVLFDNYSLAQDLFLQSTKPITALKMRRDLMHWDQALKLARTLAPQMIPELSVEYAQQLEFKGDYQLGLRMYENGAAGIDNDTGEALGLTEQQKNLCTAGIARCSIRLGDVRRGFSVAAESKNKPLCKECGVILESMKQYQEAAAMFELAGETEKAAALYIQLKNIAKAAPLMESITTPRLQVQFARLRENAGDYKAAARSYELAKDVENVVRLLLEHLNDPIRACQIVQETRSSEGAKLVVSHCKAQKDFKGAIKFLLLSKQTEEAFTLAQTHNEMESFAQFLGDAITPEQALKVAYHFEQHQIFAKAADFYAICGQYSKALKLYLQCGDKEMNKAIDVVGKARQDILTHTLVDYLMGEVDGIPKDPHYIFRLYMALGNHSQAAKTAIIISKQEQELGNYKAAHYILYETHKELLAHNLKVPQVLRKSLTLLHSYVLVKKLVKAEDHVQAARLLCRVAHNISKFPQHVVPILTSAVIECQRAGLKSKAYEFALLLMRPEHRPKIDAKYKRKIEAMVRRPARGEDTEESMSPCPYCGASIPQNDLDCSNCKNSLPFCIVTGQHMVRDDWSCCPNCTFPAIYSALVNYVKVDPVCPLCEKAVNPEFIKKIDDPTQYLSGSKEKDEPDPKDEEVPEASS